MPVSILNKLRRNAVEKLENIIANYNNRKPIDYKEYKDLKNKFIYIKDKKQDVKRGLSVKVSTIDQYNQLDINKLDTIYLGFYENLDNIIDELRKKNKEVYIWTDKILYEDDLINIDNNVIKPYKDLIHGLSVSNIGTFNYFKDKYDFKFHGDIGLNIFNSYTTEYLYSLGVDSVTLSPELTLEQIKDISKNIGGNLESIVYGYLPAMVTKTCPMALVKGCKDDSNCNTCNFAQGYGLRDRKDMTFHMIRSQGYSTIYNSVPVMVLDSINTIYNSGISMARLDFTLENKGIGTIQSIYYDYINNIVNEFEVRKFIEDYKEHSDITKGTIIEG